MTGSRVSPKQHRKCDDIETKGSKTTLTDCLPETQQRASVYTFAQPSVCVLKPSLPSLKNLQVEVERLLFLGDVVTGRRRGREASALI